MKARQKRLRPRSADLFLRFAGAPLPGSKREQRDAGREPQRGRKRLVASVPVGRCGRA